MSIRVMSRIWDDGPSDREELLVLLALADFADDAGRCYPSMASVARKARLSERGAQKIIRRLQDAGWLDVETGGGRSSCNVYTIRNPERETPNDIHRTTFTERESRKPRTGEQETPNTGSPEPSVTIIEPSVEVLPRSAAKPSRKSRIPEEWEPSAADVAKALDLGLTEPEINDEADKFRDYHRSRGSTFVDHSAAWRTWVRNALEYRARRGGMAGGAHTSRGGAGTSLAASAARRVARMGG